MVLVKALAVWFAMVIAAIASGFLRETVLVVHLGERIALPMSGVVLSILVILIVYLTSGLFTGKRKMFYLALGFFG